MIGTLAGIHLLATVFMAGVIWYVQVAHYPLFPFARGDDYPAFQRAHERRTSWVVGPAMGLELASAAGLTALGWDRLSPPLLLANGILLGGIWLSTVALQIPRHRRLESGFDADAHRFLVSSNWIRTGAWTLRAALALALAAQAWRLPAA